jgi:hypothetical protein
VRSNLLAKQPPPLIGKRPETWIDFYGFGFAVAAFSEERPGVRYAPGVCVKSPKVLFMFIEAEAEATFYQ